MSVEDCQILAFSGAPLKEVRLSDIKAEQASTFVSRVIDGFGHIQPHLEVASQQRGQKLLEAHKKVRVTSKVRRVCNRVERQLPPDVLSTGK